MSKHDRGAFGKLLAELKAKNVGTAAFYVNFDANDDSHDRWAAFSAGQVGRGRTGEEALRMLVEEIKKT